MLDLDAVMARYEAAQESRAYWSEIVASLADIPALVERVRAADALDTVVKDAEQRGREQAWGEAQFRYSADYRDLQADLVAALARAEQAEREVDAIRGREGAALTRAEQAEAALREGIRDALNEAPWKADDIRAALQAALDATQEAMRCGKCGSDGGSNHENLVQQHVWLCLNCDPESMLEALGFADIPALAERARAAEALWSALRAAEGAAYGPDIIAAMVEYEEARDA